MVGKLKGLQLDWVSRGTLLNQSLNQHNATIFYRRQKNLFSKPLGEFSPSGSVLLGRSAKLVEKVGRAGKDFFSPLECPTGVTRGSLIAGKLKEGLDPGPSCASE